MRAQQMLVSREIAQYSSLVARAIQGHKIASMEKAIEDAIAALPPETTD
jgi:predicted translin family RNA/ssDNA-binding protein